MTKFKCTVTRTDEYEIEIDETIYNAEWISHFKKDFYDFDTLERHAEHLAQFQARLGDYDFIEGYGYVTRDGDLPYSGADFDQKGNWLPESERRKAAQGINIVIVNEDNDCEVEIEDLKYDVCRVCGCTDNNPCYNPKHGNCCWADEEHTICSHCVDTSIKHDPLTVHCINDKHKS